MHRGGTQKFRVLRSAREVRISKHVSKCALRDGTFVPSLGPPQGGAFFLLLWLKTGASETPQLFLALKFVDGRAPRIKSEGGQAWP
jgi:hypothetical protein